MVPGAYPPTPSLNTENSMTSEEEWPRRCGQSRWPDSNWQPAHYRCAALPLSYKGILLCNSHSLVSKFPGAVFLRFVKIAQLLTVLARLQGAAGFSPLLTRLGAALRLSPWRCRFAGDLLRFDHIRSPAGRRFHRSMVPRTPLSIRSSVLRFIHMSASSTCRSACPFSFVAYPPP